MRYALLVMLMCGTAWAQAPAQIEFFEKKIRPVLTQQCYKCHSSTSEKVKGGLLLDSREGMLKGGKSGPAIETGNPEKSRMIEAMRWKNEEFQMPPKTKLDDVVVADFAAWVKMGAPWPKEDVKGGYAAEYERLRKELWSWQAVTNPAPPKVRDQRWVKDDIDRFILATLEEKSLTPSAPADKLSLLRRATFDLTGLPPTPDEIDAFVKDPSSEAFAKVVDRLLASPRFGERWGRHWLDVARYAESSGMSRNHTYTYAWRYRDYVIDSFNADKPYNVFVREQIAGDLLPSKSPGHRDELIIATGFLAIGPRDYNERNPRQFEYNAVDEMIDTMGRAVMATTIACARCHDHKFDPIPTADYYAMAGIFVSSEEFTGLQGRRGARLNQHSDDELIKLSAYKAPASPKAELSDDELRAQMRQSFTRLAVQSRVGGFTRPNNPPEAMAMGVIEDRRPGDIRILNRGELDQPGDVVKRGFLTIPAMAKGLVISPGESGRLELALWLTRNDNPLTPRVMVNRIWQHLFGQGLVRSVDNFGLTGETPTHPKLLDHLATRFMENGWSVKKMVRSIMLSSAYQQSANFDKAKDAIDPENLLVWRMNQRRLEAEAIRDAMLMASGRINPTRPVGSITLDLPPVEVRNARVNVGELLAGTTSRSVYLPIFRSALPEVLDAFDFADPTTVTGQRDVTTVAPQALFMLNSTFVQEQARSLAIRVIKQPTDAARVDLVYKYALGRPANNASERDRASTYVNRYMTDALSRSRDVERNRLDAWASFCQALMASAEFRYLN